MSENLVENCDRLRNYNLCSASKENNGNSKTGMHGLMKMKFLAITNYFFTQSLPYLPMVLCEVGKSI